MIVNNLFVYVSTSGFVKITVNLRIQTFKLPQSEGFYKVDEMIFKQKYSFR